MIAGDGFECSALVTGETGAERAEHAAVEASGERRTVTADNDNTYVGMQLRAELGERMPHVRKLRIALVRTVESDPGDATIDVETDADVGRGVAQESRLPRVAPPRPRSEVPDSDSMRWTKP